MEHRSVGIWTLLLCLAFLDTGFSLDNGLALTPPMGWMSWERFRCVTDCINYPDECISEKLYREMAERMAKDGWLEAGYEYIILDDCWMHNQRTNSGLLMADPVRFPSGIKDLADYVHSLGLKLGIYEDYGTLTCGGYPGSIYHLKEDAETFAKWEVDYVKFDGCYADVMDMDKGYVEFGQYLKQTNRSIVYSCSWPTYQDYGGIDPNMSLIAEHCNLWRNYDDIDDSWNSVMNIANWFISKQDAILPYAGPGAWNDPDMLIIGNYGLSIEQSKAQMAIWAVMAAPLIMSNDLRDIRPEFREILLNREIIAINQDKLGIPGRRMFADGSGFVAWTKPIVPIVNGAYSYAVTVLNKREDGIPRPLNVTLIRLGISDAPAYSVVELYSGAGPVEIPSDGYLLLRVPPTGAKIFRVTALPDAKGVKSKSFGSYINRSGTEKPEKPAKTESDSQEKFSYNVVSARQPNQ